MGFFDWFKTKEIGEPSVTENSPLNESIGNMGVVGNVGGMDGLTSLQGTAGFMGDATGLAGNFIGDSFYDTGGVFGRSFQNPGLQEIEKAYIMNQRAMSLYPEVAIGVEEILRDLFIKNDPLEIHLPGEENESFEEASGLFNKFKLKPFTVIGNHKIPDNLVIFNFIKQAYVDGRIMILSLLVDEGKLNQNFQRPKLHGNVGTILNESEESTIWLDSGAIKEEDLVSLLESEEKKRDKKVKPFDSKKEEKSRNQVRVFIPIDPMRVTEADGQIYYGVSRSNRVPIQPENLIQSDFGLFDIVGARHGFLLYAFKYANQLQSLQDMLVPMRFRRSIARRVFNVDISSLPQARAKAYMEDLMNRFKYKKHYDATSGKIVSKTNEQTGIVEDYWFANRSGNKGTTVDTLDEAGNFRDSLDDISYFNKKLYQSMFIPLRRIFESEASYDYTANSIEVDEIRFVNFLDRVRFVYNSALTQMFAVVLKDAGIEIEGMRVELKFDDWYSAAKEREDFENALSLYRDAKEHIGKLLSAETVVSKVFGMTANDISNEFEKIKTEIQKDSPFYPLYAAAESSESDY